MMRLHRMDLAAWESPHSSSVIVCRRVCIHAPLVAYEACGTASASQKPGLCLAAAL